MGIRTAVFVLVMRLILSPSAVFADEGLAIGKPAPNIIASTVMEQEPFSLSREPEKPKVINFFNRTCVPCVAEMPDFAQLEKKYPKALFYAIHVPWKKDGDADEVAVKKFVAGLKAHPGVILLGGGRLQELYRYQGLPFTVVLDGENIVRAVIDHQDIAAVEKAVMKVAQ